ncbi:TIR domain-containing protein [Rhodococcus sp. NPDC019627]|uniref:TIR domain-containing protein n=1 Tax=unclassified Rhodococcus (in: high G+C Gram-positive bacteria) TaxID=192944 RepID=UPI0037894E28
MDVFVSFDYDNDARLKDLLIGQARHDDSPFEVADWSIKTASPGWRDDARSRIRRADQVIVLCGRNTSSATGIDVEMRITREEGTPYFLLAGYQTGSLKPSAALSTDKLYNWTWPNLKALINGAR